MKHAFSKVSLFHNKRNLSSKNKQQIGLFGNENITLIGFKYTLILLYLLVSFKQTVSFKLKSNKKLRT